MQSPGTTRRAQGRPAVPNGVALSADRTHVVVAHTGPCQAFRYWIRGGPRLAATSSSPTCRATRTTSGEIPKEVNRERINATAPKHLVGVRVNSKGAEQEVMTAPKGVTLSDIAEKDGKLWLGSVDDASPHK
ncbi:protein STRICTOSIDINE SYNTHASE-LIKE 10-like [Setaria viridis]|uniref:protein STRICTOSIDINE SYNTHASE-LIKE 10-like n=1 Tax=Setaria viridis TaxID=4556 RepID=UPI001493B1C7|nr:uncharacterized protein LOC117853834 [Setaria viridis]